MSEADEYGPGGSYADGPTAEPPRPDKTITLTDEERESILDVIEGINQLGQILLKSSRTLLVLYDKLTKDEGT